MPRRPITGSLASLGTVRSIADVLGEVDVRPLRAAAERGFALAFASRDVPLAEHLVQLLRRGPREQDVPFARACEVLSLDQAERMQRFDAVVVVTHSAGANDVELALVQELAAVRVPALVCFVDSPEAGLPLRQQWLPAAIVTLKTQGGADNVLDDGEATRELVHGIRALKAVDDLALARHLPAFRPSVARSLIDDTAVANAAYSAGTGFLEINPAITVPLNMADLIVLTKNQALMSYKIGLAMGMPSDFRHIMPQMAAVVGSGFVIRQIARTLVGIIPGWGILPKVAVSFAGTYATGEVIYRWCATGEKLADDALRQTYEAALARGKSVAAGLLRKLDKGAPQPAARKEKTDPLLPPPPPSAPAG